MHSITGRHALLLLGLMAFERELIDGSFVACAIRCAAHRQARQSWKYIDPMQPERKFKKTPS